MGLATATAGRDKQAHLRGHLRAYAALVAAGFYRYATYRQATRAERPTYVRLGGVIVALFASVGQ